MSDDPNPVPSPKKEHLSAAITAQCLHRRVVDDFHRLAEGGLEVEAHPTASEIAWLGDGFAVENRTGISNRNGVVSPIARQTLDLVDHRLRGQFEPRHKFAFSLDSRHENLYVRAADVDAQNVHVALCAPLGIGNLLASGLERVRPVSAILAVLLDELGDQSRPARLVAGPEAGSRVAVEVFEKQNIIAPVRVGLKFFARSVNWTAAAGVRGEDVDETVREFHRDFPEREHAARSRRTLDFEAVSRLIVELLQRLDEQKVHRKPHGTAPIGVATEGTRRRFGRLVVDAVGATGDLQPERVLAMVLRDRTKAERAQEMFLVEWARARMRSSRSRFTTASSKRPS